MFNPDFVKENSELCLDNVAIYEFKAKVEELNPEISKFINGITTSGCEIVGPLVTANMGVQEIDSEEFIVMSILLPVKNVSLIPYPYRVVPQFKVSDNLYYRYEGSPSEIQDIYRGLVMYAQEKKLDQGVVYNCYDYKDMFGFTSEIKVDIYMNITGNEGR